MLLNCRPGKVHIDLAVTCTEETCEVHEQCELFHGCCVPACSGELAGVWGKKFGAIEELENETYGIETLPSSWNLTFPTQNPVQSMTMPMVASHACYSVIRGKAAQ